MWRTGEHNWSLYLDLQGFSALYAVNQAKALVRLGRLMEPIHRIGEMSLAEGPHRLFAHQLGDGFVVVPSFGEQTLDKPLAMAIGVLRHVLVGGGVAKAALSTGDFADVQGCYPDSVMAKSTEDGVITMGEGLMTIFPVMGSALINSYKLSSSSPSGALLVVDSSLRSDLPPSLDYVETAEGSDVLAIDWVHSQDETIAQMARLARLDAPPPARCCELLQEYVTESSACDKWKANTLRFNNSMD